MTIEYTPVFIRQFKKLPLDIQELAAQKEDLFRLNPFDHRLKTHKLSGDLQGLWALRVNYSYRIIFEFRESGIARFHFIGDHDIYE